MLRASPLNILIYALSPPSASALSTRKTLCSGHAGLSPTAPAKLPASPACVQTEDPLRGPGAALVACTGSTTARQPFPVHLGSAVCLPTP